MSYRENYNLIDWSKPLSVPERKAKETTNSHGVISDTMQPLVHPVTGKIMDSKSQFRKVTKEHGLTEVGNERQTDKRKYDMPDVRGDIARVLNHNK